MVQRISSAIAAAVLFMSTTVASASPHEARIPLHDGKFRVADLSAELLEDLHLPTTHLPAGEIDVRSFAGSLFVDAMNRSLGEGCRLSIAPDALVLHVDPDKLPQSVDEAKHAARVFTATAAPEATAAQARQYGLLLPAKMDAGKPLVVLVHGLDMAGSDWNAMAHLLEETGYQVAYFGYPDDQPIADDTALFARHMAGLRDTFPSLKVNVITFSMGSLVVRSYVEGAEYKGGIDRLILLAPPNHGSPWAMFRFVGEIKEHAQLALNDPQWSLTWMITDGLGEAGRDLLPNSHFLQELNARPRRDGVKYTIVEGDQHPIRRFAANLAQGTQMIIPESARGWWGLRQCRVGLADLATEIRGESDQSDGPVTFASAALPGVSDVVRLHADHETIYRPDGNQPPAAWETIRDRLESN